jgi:hypothetical protein
MNEASQRLKLAAAGNLKLSTSGFQPSAAFGLLGCTADLYYSLNRAS